MVTHSRQLSVNYYRRIFRNQTIVLKPIALETILKSICLKHGDTPSVCFPHQSAIYSVLLLIQSPDIKYQPAMSVLNTTPSLISVYPSLPPSPARHCIFHLIWKAMEELNTLKSWASCIRFPNWHARFCPLSPGKLIMWSWLPLNTSAHLQIWSFLMHALIWKILGESKFN